MSWRREDRGEIVFKIVNGHENRDRNIFDNIKTGKRTIGHDFTLEKGKSRFYDRKYSFCQRAINVWNKLYWLLGLNL